MLFALALVGLPGAFLLTFLVSIGALPTRVFFLVTLALRVPDVGGLLDFFAIDILPIYGLFKQKILTLYMKKTITQLLVSKSVYPSKRIFGVRAKIHRQINFTLTPTNPGNQKPAQGGLDPVNQ